MLSIFKIRLKTNKKHTRFSILSGTLASSPFRQQVSHTRVFADKTMLRTAEPGMAVLSDVHRRLIGSNNQWQVFKLEGHSRFERKFRVKVAEIFWQRRVFVEVANSDDSEGLLKLEWKENKE
jgi:hypothetical protein